MSETEEVKVSTELQQDLGTLRTMFDGEEYSVRQRQIRVWKRLEYYWAGITRIWWNDVAHDWRIFDNYSSDSGGDDEQFYDKEFNVFRAYLESIIAALSGTVPAVKCKPDDADNSSDVLTARGGTKIASLIYDHIDAPLLWVKALWVYTLQGQVFAYNYTDYSTKYGTADVADYKATEEEVQTKLCPSCGKELVGPELQAAEDGVQKEKNEFDPGNDDIDLSGLIDQSDNKPNQIPCADCQMMVDPEIRTEKVVVSRLVGKTSQPKSRQCIEVIGGLFVKVPNYARCLEDSPYLAYEYETHFTNILAEYPHLRDKFGIKNNNSRVTSSAGGDTYDRWGRLSVQYRGEYPTDTPTVRNWWLRPSAYEAITDKDRREELYKKFPDGCKIVWINDEFAEACNETIDDHWTAIKNPLSDYIHFDPLGLLATAPQDITNDLTSLTLQTIEHGIPTTIADPSVLNFDEYRNSQARPGDVIPGKARSGKNISEGFYQFSTATLSKEVMPFGDKVNEMAQFITGAMPSIWGGAEAGGSSRTAAQATMSRNQSMQRLQTTWKMMNFWWKGIFGKVIPAYIKNMIDDEKIVHEIHGKFMNEIIKRSELEGKIGDVELESSDQIPQSSMQIKDTIMQMLQSGNPQLLEMVFSPENLPFLADTIGLNGFIIPGEKDREKQYDEIIELLGNSPIQGPMNMQTGQPEMQATIQPDPDLDNHQVEAEICRDWLMSEIGRTAKVDNPEGYQNVFLHFKDHVMFLRMMAAPAPQAQNPNQNQPSEPKLKSPQ